MSLRDVATNLVFNRGRYRTQHQAVILACFYNPQRSPYRLLAFQHWYASIRHLPHRIIECTIGTDTEPQRQRQLPASPWMTHVHTQGLLWHKETLLNRLIAALPDTYRYVFWLDTDVLFTNQHWLPEAVEVLQDATILQPFGYCIHLARHDLTPVFDVEDARRHCSFQARRHPAMWRSFAANAATTGLSGSPHYDVHGHVGFAWGARREVLEAVPLYDKALMGGADHLMAHAAAGHIPHPCIAQAFPDVTQEVEAWSRTFYAATQGKVGYVPGDLYHLWHGDVAKRQYLARIKQFAPYQRTLTERDAEGFWDVPDAEDMVEDYFATREVGEADDYQGYDAGFEAVMGYPVSAVPTMFGPPWGAPVQAPEPVAQQAEASPVPEAVSVLTVETEVFTPLEDSQVGAGMSATFS